ncbi:hypothetical protein L1049_019474 [Liquidambar formosana]|uniref:Uncharacterized protein n=1 Tax=Liquidambar formosana TaxID=63359 RepID=A0AAP0SBS7_LIQFO
MHQAHELEGKMGSEQDYEPSSTPKLALFSFPSQSAEPAWMLTPPHQALASVPFQWEEAPGKPRPSTTTGGGGASTLSEPEIGRSLELPPRLLAEVKVTNMPSPTTVLDGPYVGRTLSYTFSFRKGESRKGKGNFGSWRWGGGLKENKELVEGSFDFSSSVRSLGEVISDGGSVSSSGGGGGGTEVKITRIRRKASFLPVSQTRSHLWASIYESFKQVVPWRRRQEKLRKTG